MSSQQGTNNVDDGKMPIEAALDKAGFGLYSYIMVCFTGVIIISLACLAYGVSILVPASACELNTTGGQQGAMASAPVVGSIVGAVLWGYLADTRGRRSMLLVSLLSGALINIVSSISVNWIMLLLIQFVVSVLSAGIPAMSIALLSECVPMAKRNVVILVVSSIFMLSQGVMAVLAIPIIPLNFSYYIPALGIYWNSWRTLVIVFSIPSIFSAVWLYFLQESPKFVLTKGDEERALQILKVIHKVNNPRSKEELQVKVLLQEPTEKTDGPSSKKDQIVPLFKQPLLKYTIIMSLLFAFQQVGAFVVWLPTIANQFFQILETGEGSDLTLCGIIRASLENPITNPDAPPCSLNVSAMLVVLAVGAVQSFFNLLLTLVVNIVGRRNIAIVVTAVCGLSGILVNLVPNAIGSALLFGVQLMGIIVVGPYTAMNIAIFPTQLRVIASAFIGLGGRIITFASIQVLNLMLANNCEAGFYLFASIFAASAVVAAFLPDDRRLMQKSEIQMDKEKADNNETNENASTETSSLPNERQLMQQNGKQIDKAKTDDNETNEMDSHK